MNILFLSAANSIHTVRWANALAKKGHEVHLVYNANHLPAVDNINKNVIQHKLKFGGTWAYYLNARELSNLAKSINPDVVNAHYASGYGTLARLAKLRPLVLSVWGSDVYDFPYQNTFNMKLIVKNLLYADQIASTSHCMANQVKKLLGSSSVNIEITPFGVDVEKFSHKTRNEKREKIYIGNIKSLEPKYGITDLIMAIKILKRNLESKGLTEISNRIVVQIYGDGRQKDEINDLIKQLQLTETVILKGRISNSEVSAALEEMDIFCATSILDSESFGVSVVEAMAMELPVVATDVDGFKEVIEDGKTGIIVERKNPVAIAKGLEKLVLNKELRANLGKNGRKRAIELYDWNKNVKCMEEIYKNISKKG